MVAQQKTPSTNDTVGGWELKTDDILSTSFVPFVSLVRRSTFETMSSAGGGTANARSTGAQPPATSNALQQPPPRLAIVPSSQSTENPASSSASARPQGSSNSSSNAKASSSLAVRAPSPSIQPPRRRLSSSNSNSNKDFVLSSLTTTVSLLALFAAVAFGVGAWIGMNYANKYSTMSYQLAMWGTCHDHDVSIYFPHSFPSPENVLVSQNVLGLTPYRILEIVHSVAKFWRPV
jgi:hypothetical protein